VKHHWATVWREKVIPHHWATVWREKVIPPNMPFLQTPILTDIVVLLVLLHYMGL